MVPLGWRKAGRTLGNLSILTLAFRAPRVRITIPTEGLSSYPQSMRLVSTGPKTWGWVVKKTWRDTRQSVIKKKRERERELKKTDGEEMGKEEVEG